MLNKNQFKDLIEDTLQEHGLYSPAAVNLLLGTAAQESRFGTYLKQLGTGPGKGFFQIEPDTFYYLRQVYGKKYKFSDRSPDELIWDIKLGILVCRLKYYSIKEALPGSEDLSGLANYWKKYYNTYLGKGTIEEFITNYKKYVG